MTGEAFFWGSTVTPMIGSDSPSLLRVTVMSPASMEPTFTLRSSVKTIETECSVAPGSVTLVALIEALGPTVSLPPMFTAKPAATAALTLPEVSRTAPALREML